MDVRSTSTHKTSSLPIDTPVFRATPSEVLFQKFVPHETIEVTIMMRNIDSVPRRMRVLPSESPYFFIVAPPAAGKKVAPGMELVYTIAFTPDGQRDYAEELVCITEREKFILPLRAVGRRGVLDFPDAIDFGSGCAVKHMSRKVLLVRNIGDSSAKFVAEYDTNGPFAVQPTTASVPAGETIQVVCTFAPATLGSHRGAVAITYDTGERVALALSGAAEDVSVRLEKASLRLDSTFVGLTSQRTVKLQNRSDIMVKFCWKASATDAEENHWRMRQSQDLWSESLAAGDGSDELSLLLAGDADARTHLALLDRSFRTKQHSLDNATNAYDDDVFRIEPSSGELWPNAEIEVTVIFSPKSAIDYSRNVYCDVTGRATRLPLKVRGCGLGPALEFATTAIDMGKVFVSSAHAYEVICRNVGSVDAPFHFPSPVSNTPMGFAFTVHPSAGVVAAGRETVVEIVFRPSVLGRVDERLTVHVSGSGGDGQGAPTVHFVGSVVAPTFRFATSEYAFGVVPHGFVSSQVNALKNTSLVPVHFKLHLPGDVGEEGDFAIVPTDVTIAPGDTCDVRIDLLPTQCRDYDVYMCVDIVGVGNNLVTVPIFARSLVPHVSLVTPTIDFGRTYLELPTSGSFYVELANTSQLPGKFEVLDADASTNALTVSTTAKTGTILANTSVRIPVAATAHARGELVTTLPVRILGEDQEAPFAIACGCVAEGPVVSVLPTELRWGKVQMLTATPLALTLTNESPIAAAFTCAVGGNSDGVFTCAPRTGVLAPGASATITVTARLVDTIAFADTLDIAIANGCRVEVPLRARGIGSPLVFTPPVDDGVGGGVDFGHEYSQRECVRTFTVTNGSVRTQRLWFSLDSPPPGVSGHCTVMRGAVFHKTRTPACPHPPDPSYSHFGIYPEHCVLAPNASTTVALRGAADTSGVVTETLLCHGSLEGDNSRKLVATIPVTCEFIQPLVAIAPHELHYTYAQTPDADADPQTQMVAVTNITHLPQTITVDVQGPFTLNEGVEGVVLESGDAYHLHVVYDPLHTDELHTRRDTGALVVAFAEHPRRETIALSADAVFPNLTIATDRIAFGSVLLDTFVVQEVALANPSTMPVTYRWVFESNGRNRVHESGTVALVGNTEQVFDIVPWKGTLAPGQTEVAQFFFHGHTNGVTEACVAVCEVDDGPDYTVALSGIASVEAVAYNRTAFDLGATVLYTNDATAELILTNKSHLELPFGLERLSCSPSDMTIIPTTGVIPPAGTVTIRLIVAPRVPRRLDERVEVCVGHLAPQIVTLTGRSVFPCLTLDHPAAATALPGDAKTLDYGTAVAANDVGVTTVFGVPAAARHDVVYSVHALADADGHRVCVADYVADGGRDAYYHDAGMGAEAAAVRRHVLLRKFGVITDAPGKPCPPLVLATYDVDFGPLKCEETVTKHLTITNTGPTPVSFKTSKKRLEKGYFKPFVVDTDAVENLPPGSSATIAVTFCSKSTRRVEFPLGILSKTLVLYMANSGPQVRVNFSANVCVPAVELSLPKVDFGNVQHGNSHIVYLEVHNTADVACTWQLHTMRKPKVAGVNPATAAKLLRKYADTRCFDVHPTDGTLAPHARVRLHARFVSPVGASAGDGGRCVASLPMVVDGTASGVSLDLVGYAVAPELSFDTTAVSLGPMLPGTTSNCEARFVVSNTSARPIEIFSVDFDTQYIEEARILSQLQTYSDNGDCVFLPPREPGSSLAPELTAWAAAVQQSDATTATSADEMGVNALSNPVAAANERFLGHDVRRAKYNADHGGFNAVVHGRTHAGIDARAAEWARAYGAACLTLNEIVEDAMLSSTSAGQEALALCSEAGTGVTTAVRAGTTDQHKEGDGGSDGRGVPVDGDCTQVVAPLPPPVALPPALLEDILRERLQEHDDTLDGAVVHGVHGFAYGDPMGALHLLLKLLGSRRHFVYISVELSAEDGRVYHNANEHVDAATATALHAERPVVLHQRAFDALTPAQKEAYMYSIVSFKRRVRALLRQKRDAVREALRRQQEADGMAKDRKSRNKLRAATKLSKSASSRATSVLGGRVTVGGPGAEGGAAAQRWEALAHSIEGMLVCLEQPVPTHTPSQPPSRDVSSTSDEAGGDGTGDAARADATDEEDAFRAFTESAVALLAAWDRATGGPTKEYLQSLDDADSKDKKGRKGGGKMSTKSPALKSKASMDVVGVAEDVETKPSFPVEVVTMTSPHGGESGALYEHEHVPAPAAVADMLAATKALALGHVLPDPMTQMVVRFPLPPRAPVYPGTEFALYEPSPVVEVPIDVDDGVGRGAGTPVEDCPAPPASSKSSRKKDRASQMGSRRKPGSGKGSKAGAGMGADEGTTGATSAPTPTLMARTRWVVGAHSDVSIHVRFQSKACGVFERKLAFEEPLSGRQWHVAVTGVCQYPDVVRNPKGVFASVVSQLAPPSHSQPLSRVYVENKNTIDFGPMLVGKSRDNFKAEEATANVVCLSLRNTQQHPVHLTVGLESDIAFACFTVEPQILIIAPGTTERVRVWAYPKEMGTLRDRLLVCIKNNPEPVAYHVRVEGVKPALEVESKTLAFDKVLLHRRDMQVVTLHNRTRLATAWSLAGAVDMLGPDFTIDVTKGVVPPLSSVDVPVHFKADKPQTYKKAVRLEYSDVDGVAGLAGTEALTVTAESYDVMLALVFPRNSENTLDFGTIRVGEEAVLTCTLRNKGRYELKYKFTTLPSRLKKALKTRAAVGDVLQVIPAEGVAVGSDRDKPVAVKFILQTARAMAFVDMPLIRCDIVDVHTEETIAKIPINVSATVVHNTYTLKPQRGLHFGPREFPTTGKHTREFLIENTGPLDLRFRLSRRSAAASPAKRTSTLLLGSATGSVGAAAVLSSSKLGTKDKRASSTVGGRASVVGAGQGSTHKFTIGCFTVSTGGGVVAAGASAKITVDADPTAPGVEQQELVVEVDHCDPDAGTATVVYPLTIDAQRATIDVDNLAGVFRDVVVVRNTAVVLAPLSAPTFVLDERRLCFGDVLVGKPVDVTVHISNPGVVDCTIALDVGGATGGAVLDRKGSARGHMPAVGTAAVVDDAWVSITPSQVRLKSRESVAAVVRFTPRACRAASARVAITVVGVASDYAGSRLSFDVDGAGALPRVHLAEPMTRRADGTPLLQFRRTRVGTSRVKDVTVHNPGPLPASVTLHAVQDDPTEGDMGAARGPPSRSGSRPSSKGSRRGRASRPATAAGEPDTGTRTVTPATGAGKRKGTAAALAARMEALPIEVVGALVPSDGTFTCVGGVAIDSADAITAVTVAPRDSASLRVRFDAHDTQVHNCTLRLSIADNVFESIPIHCTGEGHDDDVQLELTTDDDVVVFPDTQLHATTTRDFDVVNASSSVYEFTLDEHDDFSCIPRTGLVPPHSSKSITVVFHPTTPCQHESVPMQCRMVKVSLPPDAAEDDALWDDSMQAVRWEVVETALGRLEKEKFVDAIPPPTFTVDTPAVELTRTLALSGVSGHSLFTFTSPDAAAPSGPGAPQTLAFPATNMYQTRTARFTLTNTGKVHFPFAFTVTDDDMRASDPTASGPYTVVPRSGIVPAQGAVEVRVVYAPVQDGAHAATLTCAVPHCPGDAQPIAVDMHGTAVRPLVHVDAPRSASLLRTWDATHAPPTPGDERAPNTTMVHLVSTGLRLSRTRDVALVNPTGESFRFQWSYVGTRGRHVSAASATLNHGPITCRTARGTVQGGARVDMLFEYRPLAQDDIVETHWQCTIENRGVTIPFFIVGASRDPAVGLDCHRLALPPLLVGQRTTHVVHVVNEEDTKHAFSFSAQEIADTNKAAFLSVTPTSGTLAPRSRQAITVVFAPKVVQPFNIQLSCNIKHRRDPDMLHLECHAHAIHTTLAIGDTADAHAQTAVASDVPTAMHFGVVPAYDSVSRTVTLRNSGACAVDYEWKLDTARARNAIRVTPAMTGRVGAGDGAVHVVTFAPSTSGRQTVVLRDVPLVCHVTNGPQYKLLLNGTGQLPQLTWSFTEHDFGKTFVVAPGMPKNVVQLTITNTDVEQITVTLQFEATPWFNLCGFSTCVVQPGATAVVTIEFAPQDAVKYAETIAFSINGRTTKHVDVRGTGTPLRLELADARDRHVHLGAVGVGATVTRTVHLQNHSKLPVSFAVSREARQDGSGGVALAALACSPVGVVRDLAPGAVQALELRFAPKERIPEFTHNFSFECLGTITRFMSVQAACVGVGVTLDCEQVLFGPTCVNSAVSRRVLLTNTGDVGTKFHWDPRPAMDAWVTLAPMSGYLAPGRAVAVHVTFRPTQVNPDVRFEGIACVLDEASTKPLLLDVSGVAVACQPDKEVLTFTTPVRTTDRKNVKIHNPTDDPWHLTPVIDNGAVFSGAATIIVPPGQTKLYTVQYAPLTMTQAAW